jgi:hypothetical protein
MTDSADRRNPERVTPPDQEVVDALVRLSAGEPSSQDERRRQVARLAGALGRSARRAGAGAVVGGRWMADIVVEVVPRLGIRDGETLRRTYPGLPDDAIADALVKSATRLTTAIGAAVGAVIGVEWVALPLLLATPVELIAETLAVAVVETKLIAELHTLYDAVPSGSAQQRALAYAGAWARGRGIDPLNPVSLSLALGAISKGQLRRQLLRRVGRSLPSLAPMFAGAIAGGWVNRRDTRALADRVRRDLRGFRHQPLILR